MKTATLLLPEPPNYAGRHAAAVRFGWRMKSKVQQNAMLAAALHEHMSDVYGVTLPATRKEFKDKKPQVLQFDAYGEALETELEGLIKLHYALQDTFGTYAEFGAATDDHRRLVPLTFFYSRHRLDYAWNLRKSQLVRGRYYEYLQEARDDHGRLLTDYYHPVHLTLTVPHQGGIWQGQRFYARQLIRAFAELRKSWAWKTYVYAGEYGLEVKRSQQHGLHIHIHSFLLQNPKYPVNVVREALEAEWKELMKNDTEYSGMHYKTLYTWKKGVDNKPLRDANGYKVKEYIQPGKSPLEDYLSGVMECIKYHFKPDCLDRLDGGGFDIPLIKEILGNTKGLRMYSRFGAFYKQPGLNFNKLQEEPVDVEELSEDQKEEEVKATCDGVEERLIDPRTMLPAEPGSYRIKVGHPLRLKYYGGSSNYAREGYVGHGAAEVMLTAPPGLSLKQVIRLQISGVLARFCNPDGRDVGSLPEWAGNKTIKTRKNPVDQNLTHLPINPN